MEREQERWPAAGGVALYAQRWIPDGEAKAVVCLVHGLGGYADSTPELIDYLVAAGDAVCAVDLRGHGRSEGKRGDAPVADCLDDVDRLVADAAGRFPNLPRFLYGISFGALLALAATLRRPAAIDGVIATAAPLQSALTQQRAKMALVRALGAVLPRLTLSSGIDLAQVTRNRQVAAELRSDPLFHTTISLGCARQTVAAIGTVLAHADRFPRSLLLLHGGADKINYPGGSVAFAAKVPADCTVKVYDGLFHAIEVEPEREQIYRDVTAWIDQHLSARHGGRQQPPGRSPGSTP